MPFLLEGNGLCTNVISAKTIELTTDIYASGVVIINQVIQHCVWTNSVDAEGRGDCVAANYIIEDMMRPNWHSYRVG